ncbi:hypothetical protein KC360_g142 [Hortaea werneckii]|nr:hypothetical protein KC344_g142 [Hortaea werneckii]KAI7180458.1 hypothetical protein KC360_g142 [Hortaea werneckii]
MTAAICSCMARILFALLEIGFSCCRCFGAVIVAVALVFARFAVATLRKQGLHFLQRIVDSISSTLLCHLVRFDCLRGGSDSLTLMRGVERAASGFMLGEIFGRMAGDATPFGRTLLRLLLLTSLLESDRVSFKRSVPRRRWCTGRSQFWRLTCGHARRTLTRHARAVQRGINLSCAGLPRSLISRGRELEVVEAISIHIPGTFGGSGLIWKQAGLPPSLLYRTLFDFVAGSDTPRSRRLPLKASPIATSPFRSIGEVALELGAVLGLVKKPCKYCCGACGCMLPPF